MNKATENETPRQWLNWLKAFKNNRYDLSIAESLGLRDAIVRIYPVAVEFFYTTISPMIKGIVNKIAELYKVYIEEKDIATWIYTGMYDEGKWTRLVSYRGDCSFFAWVSQCSAQIVFKVLIEERLVVLNHAPSAKNTSLTLKSMKNIDEVEMVIELVDTPKLHDILKYKYADRIDEAAAMAKLGMSPATYKKSLKIAEDMLKEILINIDALLVEREDGKIVNLVSLALSDTSGIIDTNSSDEAMRAADKLEYDDDRMDALKEILDQYYPRIPFKDQWMHFIFDRANELKWSVEDSRVFIERFYYQTPPVEVAKSLSRQRSWVDVRYGRLKDDVEAHIVQWMQKYAS